MEFTPNFNDERRRLPVDPNAPQNGGTFGVGDRQRHVSATTSYFARPDAPGYGTTTRSCIDTAAPGRDRRSRPTSTASRSPTRSSTAAPAPGIRELDALLDVARRRSLFGDGDLDEVAIYADALSAATIAEHFAQLRHEPAPVAVVHRHAEPGQPGQPVTFNGSARATPTATHRRYEWDLDGNGTYETDTGTTPTTIDARYATRARSTVGLRVTDNAGRRPTTQTQTLSDRATSRRPPPSRDAQPGGPGQTVTVQRLGLHRPRRHDRQVRVGPRRQRHLTRPTPARPRPPRSTYATAGHGQRQPARHRQRRRHRHHHAHAHRQRRRRGHLRADACSPRPGLTDYWRMGEASGTTLANAQGSQPAPRRRRHARRRRRGHRRRRHRRPLRRRQRLRHAPTSTCPAHQQADGRVLAEVERLRQRRPPGDGVHTELQPRTPAASWSTPTPPSTAAPSPSASARGARATTCSSPARAPAPGTTTRSCSTPRRRRDPDHALRRRPARHLHQARQRHRRRQLRQLQLYLMSRAAQRLFGAGDLDEVAIYNRALSAADDRRPLRAAAGPPGGRTRFTATPNPVAAGQRSPSTRSPRAIPTARSPSTEWDLDGNGTYETDTGRPPR